MAAFADVNQRLRERLPNEPVRARGFQTLVAKVLRTDPSYPALYRVTTDKDCGTIEDPYDGEWKSGFSPHHRLTCKISTMVGIENGA